MAGIGLGTGTLSGLFGISGDLLIVAGLMLATGMPIGHAVDSSPVAVTAFGLTTSFNYAASGHVSRSLAAVVIAGGIIGGLEGTGASHALAGRRGALNLVFAGLIFATTGYMLVRSLKLV